MPPQKHAQLTAREIHGPYTQLLTNLQGDDGRVWLENLKRFNRKENSWPRGWVSRQGKTYFQITSDGTTGEDWIARLQKKGVKVTETAIALLRSRSFRPTSNVTTSVAVVEVRSLRDSTRHRLMQEADAEVKYQQLSGLVTPEIVCLIRYRFSDEDLDAMGLFGIAGVHKPVVGLSTDPLWLGFERSGTPELDAFNQNVLCRFAFGFAFRA